MNPLKFETPKSPSPALSLEFKGQGFPIALLPRITLVTPSFNQAAFLEETIRSVLDQNYPNLQYGVVDGGSTDGSIDIIKRYADRLAFTIIEPDGGQSDAINKGLRLADGEVVGWLCSDDTLLPGALDTIGVRFAVHPKTHWVVGRCLDTDATGAARDVMKAEGEFTLAGALIRERPFNIPQPATFWRRALTDAAGLLDPSLHHCMDFDLWCQFLAAGHRPVLIDRELATYRHHDASKSSSQQAEFIRTLIAIEKRYAPLLTREDRRKVRRMIGYQTRALAIQDAGGRAPWAALLTHPWWLASQQVRAALRRPKKAA